MFNYEVAAKVTQLLDNQNCQHIFMLVKHLHLCLSLEYQRVDRPCDLLIHLRAISNDRVVCITSFLYQSPTVAWMDNRRYF
jgi:hypothetical protein